MADTRDLLDRLQAQEDPLLDLYERIARSAATATERQLAAQMVRSQKFQLSTLELIASGRVPEKFHCFGTITHENVNVRGGPGSGHDRIGGVDRGLPVIVMEFQGNWAHIQTPDGKTGWIFVDYVRCELEA